MLTTPKTETNLNKKLCVSQQVSPACKMLLNLEPVVEIRRFVAFDFFHFHKLCCVTKDLF